MQGVRAHGAARVSDKAPEPPSRGDSPLRGEGPAAEPLVLAAWMSGRPLAPLHAVLVCLPVPSPRAAAGFLLLVSHRIL